MFKETHSEANIENIVNISNIGQSHNTPILF